MKASNSKLQNSNKLQNPNFKILKIKPKKEAERIVGFIRAEVKRAGLGRVIVAVSGGVDSTTVLHLCVRALGRKNVLVALLPYGELNWNGIKDIRRVFKELKVPFKNIFERDIKPMVESFQIPNFKFQILPPQRDPANGGTNKLQFSKSKYQNRNRGEDNLEKIRLGNVMARVRMIILFDLAKRLGALVCGTENKSEYLLGYYTRFGDEASDLEPIRHLYKTQVLELAKYLGVPREILEKPPTAGLWGGQTDESELGFSYEEADPILFLHFEKKYLWRRIKLQNPNSKIQTPKSKKIEKIVEKIRERVEGNWFKKEVPIIMKNLR